MNISHYSFAIVHLALPEAVLLRRVDARSFGQADERNSSQGNVWQRNGAEDFPKAAAERMNNKDAKQQSWETNDLDSGPVLGD